MLGVSHEYVADAKQITKDAPDLLDEVEQGKLSIPQAERVAARPIKQRPAAIERIHRKEPEAGGWIYWARELGASRRLRRATLARPLLGTSVQCSPSRSRISLRTAFPGSSSFVLPSPAAQG